jgi:TPR repeat protein
MRSFAAALFCALLLLSSRAFAGPYEEAQLAYGHENWPAAYKLLLPLAEAGDARAQYEVGMMYMSGWAVKQDYAQAAAWYLKSAQQGNADAQLILGRLCEQGHGVPKDYAQALAWYHKSADQENPTADMLIGLAYRDGRGVPQDGAAAVTWLGKAAHYPDAMAGPMSMRTIAEMYAQGRGIARNDAEALGWYRKLAETGDALSQIEVGLMYELGNTAVKQDHAEADRWYRTAASGMLRAAELGNSWARYRMNMLFAPGEDARADKWFARAAPGIQRAADEGNKWAQGEMGLLYTRGWGVGKDPAEAYFWRSLAVNGAEIPDAAAVLTQEQRDAVKKRIAAWKPVDSGGQQ